MLSTPVKALPVPEGGVPLGKFTVSVIVSVSLPVVAAVVMTAKSEQAPPAVAAATLASVKLHGLDDALPPAGETAPLTELEGIFVVPSVRAVDGVAKYPTVQIDRFVVLKPQAVVTDMGLDVAVKPLDVKVGAAPTLTVTYSPRLTLKVTDATLLVTTAASPATGARSIAKEVTITSSFFTVGSPLIVFSPPYIEWEDRTWARLLWIGLELFPPVRRSPMRINGQLSRPSLTSVLREAKAGAAAVSPQELVGTYGASGGEIGKVCFREPALI